MVNFKHHLTIPALCLGNTYSGSQIGQAYCEVLVTSFLSNFYSTSGVEWFYMLIVILLTFVTHEFVSGKKDLCCKVIPSKSVNFQHSRLKSMWFIVEIKGIVLSNTELGHCCLI